MENTARFGGLVAVLFLAACASVTQNPAPTQPYVVVLGTAQDGGLPQLGCRKDCCERAREDPSQRRLVASLLLVDPRDGRRWLFDASPDLPEQVERARGHGSAGAFDENTPARPPLFDGIFLTHAHMGHCAGLLHLGREAYGTQPTPLIGTPRLCAFLESEGPFELLVTAEHLKLQPLDPGASLELAPDLRVSALSVPHREEYSDTVAFRIEGPSGTVLYLPDIDKWERWDRPLAEALEGVDVAYLDGTFYGPGEIPGRDMSEVPHPFVVETMELLKDEQASVRSKVRFLHLNHSNPAARTGGEEAKEIASRGFGVAVEGEVTSL